MDNEIPSCPFCGAIPERRLDYQVPHVNCKTNSCALYKIAIPINLWKVRAGCDQLVAVSEAITQAAIKVGIIDGSQPLTGPQLILLCEDLAKAAGAHK